MFANKNINLCKKANIIRTNLLLSINQELISQEKQYKNQNILINSKKTQTYCNEFENYVIVERDIITCSQKDYKRLKEKDELPLFLFKLQLFEDSPIVLKTQKMRITKNPQLKRRSSQKCMLKKKNEDIIESNIKNLIMFCNLLKSKIKVEEKIMSGRNKSQIKRRKKYNKIKSSNNLSCIKKFTYFNEFENYVIVERDIITNSQKDYKRLKEKDELPLYLVKLNLKESSPINLNVAKKLRLTKNPDFYSKKCLSGKCELNDLEKDKKLVEINIRYLRTFCNLLKSNNIIIERKNNGIRNKSQIIRRKKFSRQDCNNGNYELKNLLNKENKNYYSYNNKNNDNIIQLHKMWDTDKNYNKINDSNMKFRNKKHQRNLTLLSIINNNKQFIKNLKLGKV
jgi:hypothetical protein